MEHIIREAIEIQLHPDNVNREEGFSLNKSEATHSNSEWLQEGPL
jgi:hypothetical protein